MRAVHFAGPGFRSPHRCRLSPKNCDSLELLVRNFPGRNGRARVDQAHVSLPQMARRGWDREKLAAMGKRARPFLPWALVATVFVPLAVLGTIGIFGAVLALFAVLLWKWPKYQVASLPKEVSDKDRFQLENEARKTLAQIFGGLILLAGAYGTVWSLAFH